MATADAYFAGLFDGEGCVFMSLSKKAGISISVKVSMCDRPGVYALHRRFGGYFSDGNQKTKHGRSIFTWTAYNAASVEALTVFSELCLVKCGVAAAALPIAIEMRDNKTRGALTLDSKLARIAAAEFIAKVNKPVGDRRVLVPEHVEQYLKPKTMGGGKKVRLQDGRIFSTVSEAAKALGVTISAVYYANKKGGKTAGQTVEYV